MANNPLNLAVRFLLELCILVALGYWAWNTQTGLMQYVLVILLPLVAAAVWGIFRTPADHGKGLVATPGVIRLFIELLLFGAAWYCFKDAGKEKWAMIFLIVSAVHYLVSYDRVLLLLGVKNAGNSKN